MVIKVRKYTPGLTPLSGVDAEQDEEYELPTARMKAMKTHERLVGLLVED